MTSSSKSALFLQRTVNIHGPNIATTAVMSAAVTALSLWGRDLAQSISQDRHKREQDSD